MLATALLACQGHLQKNAGQGSLNTLILLHTLLIIQTKKSKYKNSYLRKMSKYKIYTQKPSKVTFDMADGMFDLEMEALNSIDAEIIEVDTKSEDEFIDAVRGADALIARGRNITRKIIENCSNCGKLM